MPKKNSVAALWAAPPLRPKKRHDFRKKCNRRWGSTHRCEHCRKRSTDFAWNWTHTRRRDAVFHAKCFKDGRYKQCAWCRETGTPQNMRMGAKGDATHRTAWFHSSCAGCDTPAYRLLRKRHTHGGIFL